MKKIILLSATIFLINFSFAQMTVHDNSAFLDINQIKARICTGGLNFFDPEDTIHNIHFQYPADSITFTIFSSALWVGAKNQGNLHLAAERFHQGGRDFYPGPIMDSTQYLAEVANWNKVWKINKSEIDNHIINWNTPGYVIPNSISNWPVYANPSLNINHDLAPYVDTDSDGFYNPANGDYPYIRGDQAIYFIFNDSVFRHSETGGNKLGVEVHAMAYAYNSNSLLEKTIFVNYLVYNNSLRIYDSTFIGLYTDIDLGFAFDDYIGCDTAIETYYVYNGDSLDGGSGLGYESNPPVQTVTLLNQQMTSFAYFNNTGGFCPITDPFQAYEYFLLMKNYWKDSTHFCYGGPGHLSVGGNPAIPVKYMFPGYPNDSTQWNEINAGNSPGDRRGVGISGPFTMLPGQYISFDAAYILVDSSIAKTIGQFPNVDNMLQAVPLIRSFFNTTFPQDGNDLALGIEADNNSEINQQYSVYPNPATDKITITTIFNKSKTRFEVFDINGSLLQSFESSGSKTLLDVSAYKNGMYILKIQSDKQCINAKFVKM